MAYNSSHACTETYQSFCLQGEKAGQLEQRLPCEDDCPEDETVSTDTQGEQDFPPRSPFLVSVDLLGTLIVQSQNVSGAEVAYKWKY